MKKLLISICSLILCISVCACGGNTVISYEQTPSVTYAENLYSSGNIAQYKEFCNTMAGNNDDKTDRDNFFNYVLVKAATVNDENLEAEYENTLEIISACLALPLTQEHVVSGLKAMYRSIDDKLTQKTKEYLKGKWTRSDSGLLNGSVMEIYETEDGLLESRFTGLPDADTTSFKIGDIKWKNLQFANYKTFYLSDLVNSKINVETYYKSDDKTVSEYKGATAKINFEENKITVVYDSGNGYQIWIKQV